MSSPVPAPGPSGLKPSSSILEGVRQGDAVAWSRLARLCAPVVARWCRRSGLQDADVDNVVQEVFRTLARTVQDFRRDRGSGSFAAWLFTVTRSRIADWRQARQRQPPAVGGSDFLERLEQEPAPADDSSSAAINPTAMLCRRALDLVRPEFTVTTWQAFWRSTIDGHDTADIATDLGMTANAVRLAKSRVLRRLREELGDLFG
jgi:RNA polymerase sigma-70 factor (ECF subfamily)